MTEAKRGYRRSADELAKLADLHAWGIITDAEFQRGKVQILANQGLPHIREPPARPELMTAASEWRM